jgi:hypothetical protein
MRECPRLITCPFFNEKMPDKPATTELYKQRYCRDEYEKCARYMVFIKLGKEKVPADLFPNDIKRAQDILKSG